MNNTLDVTKTLDLQELEIDTFEVEELSGLDVDASAASGRHHHHLSLQQQQHLLLLLRLRRTIF